MFEWFMARKYLRRQGFFSMIHLLSLIASFGVGVGTCALVVILSVFNGFEHLITDLYKGFDPDFKVESFNGNSFPVSRKQWDQLSQLPAVKACAPVIEEQVLLEANNKKVFATLRGIRPDFLNQLSINLATDEKHFFDSDSKSVVYLGQGVAWSLGTSHKDPFAALTMFALNKDADPNDPSAMVFYKQPVVPTGTFSVQQDIDNALVLMPEKVCRNFLQIDSAHTSHIQILLKEGAPSQDIRSELKKIFPDKHVLDEQEQHAFIYRIMRIEKLAVFFILLFVLILASFNTVASLTMLLIAKQRDMAMLSAMGNSMQSLRKLFFRYGLLVSLNGMVPGLISGLLISLGQQHFGWIRLGEEGSFIVNAYPVKVEWPDLLLIALTIMLIASLSAWYSLRGLSKMEQAGLVRLLRRDA